MYITKISLFVVVVVFFNACSTRTKSGYIHHGETTSQKPKSYYHPTMIPYTVHGKRYYPSVVHVGEVFHGRASWYGPNFNGKLTSNGETYDMHSMTAAHKTLPINTYVRVTNLNNGLETVVRINDRGPFVAGRIIDLSYQAAKEIGLIKTGVAPVKLEVISTNECANKYAYKRAKKVRQTAQSDNAKKNRYFVQIASLYSKSKAIRLKSKYASLDKKYKAYLTAQNEQSKKVYKLLIGRFATSKDALKFIKYKNLKNATIVRD